MLKLPASILMALVLLTATPLLADSPKLAFKPSGEKDLFEFNTGVLRGTLKLDGRFQGIYPLVDVASGQTITRPPGIFSYYRVFTTAKRYGNAARDWPTQTKVLPNGGVEVQFTVPKEYPLAMTAVYRWVKPNTLDLETIVTPKQDLPRFEIFMSSYYTKGFRASAYVKPKDAAGKPAFAPIDRTPGARGGYVMFPRDKEGPVMINDGRWKIPPSAVDWAIGHTLAAPLMLRRDSQLGLTAVVMSAPDDCFAMSSPWNPATPTGGGYRSLYQSLYGEDLKAGKPARVHMRLVIDRNLTDAKAVELYNEYIEERRP